MSLPDKAAELKQLLEKSEQPTPEQPTPEQPTPEQPTPEQPTPEQSPVAGMQIGVVVSTYNANITRRLLEGSLQTLTAAGWTESHVLQVHVPGAWELPLAAKRLAAQPQIRGVITLGAVIRGETTHDQHINRAVSQALMELMMSTGKPIGFGLLTCNTLEQAIHRAGGNVGNKGCETAQAVLAMLSK